MPCKYNCIVKILIVWYLHHVLTASNAYIRWRLLARSNTLIKYNSPNYFTKKVCTVFLFFWNFWHQLLDKHSWSKKVLDINMSIVRKSDYTLTVNMQLRSWRLILHIQFKKWYEPVQYLWAAKAKIFMSVLICSIYLKMHDNWGSGLYNIHTWLENNELSAIWIRINKN